MSSVYLAGPEVFLPDPLREQVQTDKRQRCEYLGITALIPGDNDEGLLTQANPALAIYEANLALLQQADGIIANLSPFRGPSADVGTVFELGLMLGLGRSAVGYSVCDTPFPKRIPGGARGDRQGYAIEPFGLPDNLMLPCSLFHHKRPMITGQTPYEAGGIPPERLHDPVLFQRALEQWVQLPGG